MSNILFRVNVQNNVEPLLDHNITSAAGTELPRAFDQMYDFVINPG